MANTSTCTARESTRTSRPTPASPATYLLGLDWLFAGCPHTPVSHLDVLLDLLQQRFYPLHGSSAQPAISLRLGEQGLEARAHRRRADRQDILNTVVPDEPCAMLFMTSRSRHHLSPDFDVATSHQQLKNVASLLAKLPASFRLLSYLQADETTAVTKRLYQRWGRRTSRILYRPPPPPPPPRILLVRNFPHPASQHFTGHFQTHPLRDIMVRFPVQKSTPAVSPVL